MKKTILAIALSAITGVASANWWQSDPALVVNGAYTSGGMSSSLNTSATQLNANSSSGVSGGSMAAGDDAWATTSAWSGNDSQATACPTCEGGVQTASDSYGGSATKSDVDTGYFQYGAASAGSDYSAGGSADGSVHEYSTGYSNDYSRFNINGTLTLRQLP